MSPQQPHALLPVGDHDQTAREAFCSTLRNLFTSKLWPGCRRVYQETLLPAFVTANGREPDSVKEVETLMQQSYYCRAVGLLGRTAQELLWDVVGEQIEPQLPALAARARPQPTDLGSVRTDPALPMPRYIEAVDIHVMPGNFQTELGPDDVYAGALYDRGVHVFSYGGLGPRNENYGEAVVAMIRQQFPDLQPRRILDLGTGIGNVALPLARAFPEAEVHGVDIGAPMVRYAHGRAESLGVKVHFSQQDAAHLDFPDGHFDLVVSMLLTHEAPVPVLRDIFKEVHRVLAPGGVMMHDGVFQQAQRAPLDEYMVSWFGPNANEPFSAGFRRLNFSDAFAQAGFAPERFFTGSRPPVYLKGYLPDINFLGAVK